MNFVQTRPNMTNATLKSDSLLPKKFARFVLIKKSFKNNEKFFLFYLKSSFHFQDI